MATLWELANVTGRRFSLHWRESPGDELHGSGALYRWGGESIPLRSTSAIAAQLMPESLPGSRWLSQYSLNDGALRVGRYTERHAIVDTDSGEEVDVFEGPRTLASWTLGDVGVWTDVEPHDESWVISLFQHLSPGRLYGSAVLAGADKELWNDERRHLGVTINGFGLLSLASVALEAIPRASEGTRVPAGWLFRSKGSDSEPGLVLLGDDGVVAIASVLEVTPDSALETMTTLLERMTSDEI